jgi:hypothetical protein
MSAVERIRALEHYAALLEQIRVELMAVEIPVTEADYLPRSYVARESDELVF